jgi:hypothetical protein
MMKTRTAHTPQHIPLTKFLYHSHKERENKKSGKAEQTRYEKFK